MNSRFPHNPLRLGLYAQTVSVIVGGLLPPPISKAKITWMWFGIITYYSTDKYEYRSSSDNHLLRREQAPALQQDRNAFFAAFFSLSVFITCYIITQIGREKQSLYRYFCSCKFSVKDSRRSACETF